MTQPVIPPPRLELVPATDTPRESLPDLEVHSAGGLGGTCCCCERSFSCWIIVDPVDGENFEVCELCLPVLGGCRGLGA